MRGQSERPRKVTAMHKERDEATREANIRSILFWHQVRTVFYLILTLAGTAAVFYFLR